jgi:hypothetical protein
MVDTQQTNIFAGLHKQQYANLNTFRKSGATVVTPVWFALENGKVYVMTVNDSGKVKRIRNNARVQLAPATRSGQALGPYVDATARILTEDEVEAAKAALDRKYGLLKATFDFFMTLRGTDRAWIEIVPS